MVFSFFVCFCLLFASENVDGFVSIVEKEVLLKSEVLQQAYLMASQQGLDPYKNPYSFDVLYKDVLKQMENNLVLYDLASKDTNVVVLDEEVEESLGLELKRRVDLAGSVSALEQMLGEHLSIIRSKLRLEIKKSMQIEKYTSSIVYSVQPSLFDVKSFYVNYKDSLPFLEKRFSFSVFEWPVSVGFQKKEDLFGFLNSLKDSVLLGFDSFGSLAKKHSQDTGSSQNGGSLGYTLRGSLVPEYENVAFSLSVGEVSSPFVSPFGAHIVLLEDRLGEKIKTSHILKRFDSNQQDFNLSLDSLNSFLGGFLVYNNVNKFDSLCVHHKKSSAVFQGVFRSVPNSSLPEFLEPLKSAPLGFVSPFLFEEKIYTVRLFEVSEKEKQTLQNNYENIYNLTRSLLIEEKISNLINSHSKKIYIKKFY